MTFATPFQRLAQGAAMLSLLAAPAWAESPMTETADPARAEAPSPEAASSRIQRVISPGGIEAWLVEEHAIPMITVEIAFPGGASLDPEGKSGAAALAADLVTDGAGDMEMRAFQEALDDTAAQISAEVSRDATYVSFKTLLRNAEPSFELLRLALTEPRFDEDPFTRSQGQILSNLQAESTDPESRAGKAWMSAMFPGDSYGLNVEGSEASVSALTREDLSALWPKMTSLNGAYFGVVGAISAEELGPLLDEIFGGLATEAPDLPAAVEPRQTGGLAILTEDVPQSVAIFGHRGVLRDDDDYMAIYVMNHILGGGSFTSRLMLEVRERGGLAYSVYSYLSPNDRAGLHLGAVATANERIGESLDKIRSIWRDVAENGVTEEELRAAKDYLTGSFALRFDSNAKIARFLVGAQRADLGIDYIDRRNDLVEALTLEDINRVASEHLHPDALFIIVAGAPEGIEATEEAPAEE